MSNDLLEQILEEPSEGNTLGKVITIASGKGGTGKTTVAAAISSCLAVLGHKTLCIDFDTELRNLDLALCMTDFTVMDFSDVLSGRVELINAYSESPNIPNLFFLSTPSDCIPEDIDKDALKDMFDEIRENFEYCIIDAPAGISIGFQLAHSFTDMSILVALGDLASIRDAVTAAGCIRKMGIENMRLIVNRVQRKNYRQIRTSIDDVIDVVGVQLIGIIREDKSIYKALHENTPIVLYKKRRSAYDFLDIARRITGEEIPLKQCRRLG